MSAGTTCATTMARAAATTTPAAPEAGATAHPSPMLATAMTIVHAACHRASGGSVNSTVAGRCIA
jgi:hypothetical protein